MTKESFIFAALVATALYAPAMAADEAATLSIEDGDGHMVATFSQRQLRAAFPQHVLDTATPWSNGEIKHFKGPYLSDVLKKYNLAAGDIEVAATDNYVTTLRSTDITTYNPEIAIDMACETGEGAAAGCVDGYKPLDLQNSGPFYIVWPLKDFPQYYKETKNSMWVWFVAHLRPDNK